jgi:hypothetical protein
VFATGYLHHFFLLQSIMDWFGILGWARSGDIVRAFGGFFSGYPTIERHQSVMKGKIIYFDFGESSFRV